MHPFATFEGDWPEDKIVWDGRGANGKLVESCSDYTFVARLKGVDGIVGEARATLSTGVVLLSLGTHYTISVSSITFKADSADYLGLSPEQSARNAETLRLLARKLRQFPDFNIRIEGHAVQTEWRDPAKAAREQRESLIPLSKARAAAILEALASLGIDRGRMVAIGVGARDPVVPDSDERNRWKNRRVVFSLERSDG
jgi:Outer membrane protein and related peptidoglycan-associated (lipo)proteins